MEAEAIYKKLLELSKERNGPQHHDTLTSMANLASIYRDQGRWDEAEKLGVQVMEKRKRVLGAEHSDTLTSMANVASTYRYQGRWDEAEKLGIQVMEKRKRHTGFRDDGMKLRRWEYKLWRHSRECWELSILVP